MKIFLLSPDSDPTQRAMRDLSKNKLMIPPLGILYLGSSAKRAGHEVFIYDEQVSGALSIEELCRRVKDFGADVFGSSVITVNSHYVQNICAQIKGRIPGITTIVGGPHVTTMREDALDPAFDFLFIGEADASFPRFLELLESKSSAFSEIPGLCFKDKGEKNIYTGKKFMETLSELPPPDRSLLKNVYKIKLPSGEIVPTTGVLLTRGCPFRCAFCAETAINENHYRRREAGEVADEIEMIQRDFGIDHFCFYDSTLTVNRKLIVDFCHELIRRDLKITWEGWTRANMIDEELAVLMKKTGFVRMAIGVESGNQHILDLIEKKVKLQDIRNVFKMFKKLKICAESFAMIGLPGETKETMYNTMRFIRSIPEIQYSSLGVVIPYPGTKVHHYAKTHQHGLKLLSEDYREYHRYGKGVMEVDGMQPEEIAHLQKRLLVLMHMTPYKIFSLVKHFGFFNLLRAYLEWVFPILFGKKEDAGMIEAHKIKREDYYEDYQQL